MATQYDDFWSKAGPGMLDLGAGLYTRNLANREGQQRLDASRGPLYNQQVAGASGMLSAAGTFDPNAFAADRFNQQQALVNPVYAKQEDDLMRSLRAKGQLGVSSFNPGVEGITPNGVAMNPKLAALYAAQNAQRSKDAYGSLREGQGYLDSTLNRANNLSGAAAGTQTAGMAGQGMLPSRAGQVGEILRGASGILRDTGVAKSLFSGVPGMFGSGMDWIKNMFATPDAGMDFGDFSNLGNFDFT